MLFFNFDRSKFAVTWSTLHIKVCREAKKIPKNQKNYLNSIDSLKRKPVKFFEKYRKKKKKRDTNSKKK